MYIIFVQTEKHSPTMGM